MCDVEERNAQSTEISMRKIKKPLIEKKRRDRINKCLAELKAILLKDIQHTGTQISRLDKADVLELTVKYLQTIQRNQITAAVTSDPIAAVKYESGFKECAQETIRYLKFHDGRKDLAKRLDNHLSATVKNVLRAREDQRIVNVLSTPLTLDCSHFSQNNSIKYEPISPPISAFQETYHQNYTYDVKPSLSTSPDKAESSRRSISAQINQVVVPCKLESVWRPW
ncbi:hypothetical protein CHS0354_025563 [Potamilus streckersoni]|uniref:Uncharacterized protein n=1 Tax=Potamilus streckersoni TaxID=2493646 RepID=A0AAE0VNQ5_9BIVA|nr:hypothetical protein CHS0354_025563 [Potamilus streckersoni]